MQPALTATIRTVRSRWRTFTPPPQIRLSQAAVNGVLASDGITPISPAQNQYENCLRCHGTSSGKPTSSESGYLPVRYVSTLRIPVNVIPQFAATATSSHPVTHVRFVALPSAQSSYLYVAIGRRYSGTSRWVRRFSARIATTAMTIANSEAGAERAAWIQVDAHSGAAVRIQPGSGTGTADY